MNEHLQRVYDVVHDHYAQTALMAHVVIMDQHALFEELQYVHDFLNVEVQYIESIDHQLGQIQGLVIYHLIKEPGQYFKFCYFFNNEFIKIIYFYLS